MPDEPMDLTDDVREESSPRQKAKKSKKKSRKGALLFLFLFLLGGTAAGLHFSGAWDGRPLLYRTVPRIPWIGRELAAVMNIPAEYSFTTEERRALELRRWSDRLNEWERELGEREARLQALSDDLGSRASAVEQAEAEQKKAPARTPEDPEEEKVLLEKLMRTYEEISPRKAAQILEQVREDLAVRLLEKMSQDARGAILGRMEAARAARLTERLAAGGSR